MVSDNIGYLDKKVGRPKGVKIVVKTSIIDFSQEQLDKVEFLMKKWDMKTRSKVLEKCLEKIYSLEVTA